MKIGPVDPEIALLNFKKKEKKEINASKIYSPVGRFAERAKKLQQPLNAYSLRLIDYKTKMQSAFNLK